MYLPYYPSPRFNLPLPIVLATFFICLSFRFLFWPLSGFVWFLWTAFSFYELSGPLDSVLNIPLYFCSVDSITCLWIPLSACPLILNLPFCTDPWVCTLLFCPSMTKAVRQGKQTKTESKPKNWKSKNSPRTAGSESFRRKIQKAKQKQIIHRQVNQKMLASKAYTHDNIAKTLTNAGV